jgi:hypothetical protein
MSDRRQGLTGDTQPGSIRDSGRAGVDDAARGREPFDGLSRPEDAADEGRTTRGTDDVDDAEREVITSGTAATSEVGDPAAQEAAGRRRGGPPQRRGGPPRRG